MSKINSSWHEHLDKLDNHYSKDFFSGQNSKPNNEPNVSEHFFAPALTEETDFPEEGQLNVDIFQDEKNLYIVAPIAGVDSKKVSVTLDNDILTIKGERSAKTEVEEKDYLYHECHWGLFSRSIVLPVSVKQNQVDAKMEDGVLKISLPKETESKKINVKINTR